MNVFPRFVQRMVIDESNHYCVNNNWFAKYLNVRGKVGFGIQVEDKEYFIPLNKENKFELTYKRKDPNFYHISNVIKHLNDCDVIKVAYTEILRHFPKSLIQYKIKPYVKYFEIVGAAETKRGAQFYTLRIKWQALTRLSRYYYIDRIACSDRIYLKVCLLYENFEDWFNNALHWLPK